MDLMQIRYFLALSRTLNFTRAAALCHVTQPALTKSIQRLEAELGGPLLLRERNNTQLTELGAAMLPLLQQTYDAAETARSAAQRFRRQEAEKLRIGLGSFAEPGVVAPLIRQVARRFPALEVTVVQDDLAGLNKSLLSAAIDVTLVADADRLSDRVNHWRVFSDPIVAMMPQDHALAGARRVTVAQLRGEALIGRIGPAAADGPAETDLESRCAVAAAIRHRGQSEDHVHMLVRAGLGLALSTARRALPDGLVSRAIDPPCAVEVCVASVPGRPMSRAADAFLRLARARAWEDAA